MGSSEVFRTFCHICRGHLVRVPKFSGFLQVTSDCRSWKYGGELGICQICGTVQKPVTEDWLNEVNDIYDGYSIYSQSGGIEQSSFNQQTGVSQSRSAKLVDWFFKGGYIQREGKLLDIGCGNGAFLRAFGSVFPMWSMTGLELNDRNRDEVEAIPGVELFQVGSIESLPGKFNFISLIHALEHIPEPVSFLCSLKKKLLPYGYILIEVPNLVTSPFDILIADHCSHYTPDTLLGVIQNTPFNLIQLKEDYIPKELTLVLQQEDKYKQIYTKAKEDTPEFISMNSDLLEHHLHYLEALLNIGNNISGKFGILGTSIAATWLAKSLPKKVAFFVDEDTNRIGRFHLGKPIISPAEVESRTKIILPFPYNVASDISKRLSFMKCELLFPEQ